VQNTVGGFMSKLSSKISRGQAALGAGAGLFAGGILEHEWDRHGEHRRPYHFGGLANAFGFGGGRPTIIEEKITFNNDTYVDDNNTVSFWN
jgi:hypothetical protein